MASNSEPSTNSPESQTSIPGQSNGLLVRAQVDLRKLRSAWPSLTTKEQRYLWLSSRGLRPILDSLYWMQNSTKTRDDQDPNNPYKPFPDYHYLKTMHYLWQKEPILFVEKSRTMMASWFFAAETLHGIMTQQPSTGIFWAQDEDRATKLLDYAWVLYEQQDERMKALYPLDRSRDRQTYKRLELKDGGVLQALPGKDPDKIRSEHPSIVIMDEACFIENGGEAFDVAISSKVPKVGVVSSAAPSWFRRMTKQAKREELPAV